MIARHHAPDQAIDSSDGLVFPAAARWSLTGGALVVGLVLVATSGFGTSAFAADERDRYVLAHAVGAAPFLTVGLICAWRTLGGCPREYRHFWRRWFAAGITGVLATAAAITAVLTGQRVFLVVDMAMLALGVPLWTSAMLHMVRAQAGRWSMSVDVLDAITAVVVLGSPGVLLLAEPLGRTDQLGYAVPFVLMAVLMPAVVYLSLVNLSRIRRGERGAQGIGIALAAAFTVNVTMQLAYVVGDLALPLKAVLSVHVLNMGLSMVLPVWAHRHPTRSPPEDQAVRRSPMPYVSAIVLPAVGLHVLFVGRDRPWQVVFFCVVLLAVVALNAVRYTALSREARRLSAGLARMSEERRRLLAGLLRGLEDDRRRTATELHSQTLGALATLGSIVQTAYHTLPLDVAGHVGETVAQLQRDLCDRAEELRQLMVAMRQPGFDSLPGTEVDRAGQPHAPDRPRPPDHEALAAALQAFAAELYRERPTREPVPVVRVHVDPELRLDWSTGTIAYRIAQEALRAVARRTAVTEVSVRLTEDDGAVLLEVHDDGRDRDLTPPRRPPPDPGVATMELFAHLGRGDVVVRSSPEGGRTVRSRLGVGSEPANDRGRNGGRDRDRARPDGDRHLHLITNVDLDV